jgi:hypothetical protein
LLTLSAGSLQSRGRVSRTTINTTDESWTGKGIDPIVKINEVRAITLFEITNTQTYTQKSLALPGRCWTLKDESH